MRKLIALLKEWKQELIGIPIGLALFFIAPFFYRMIDPTAGSYDAGVLQVIIFAVIALPIFSAVAWLGIKLTFPDMFTWFQNGFKHDLNNIDKWQKIKICVTIYLVYLLSLVWLCRVL